MIIIAVANVQALDAISIKAKRTMIGALRMNLHWATIKFNIPATKAIGMISVLNSSAITRE